MPIADWEQAEVDRANASKRKPVVFVHGLWILGSSWQPWRDLFEQSGYTTIAPGWPDDPTSVAEGRANPSRFAGKSIKQVTDHFEEVIHALDRSPAIIGHSFGGLITQQLAGRGLATVSVAYDSAPFRGVLPLPFSALKSAFPVIGNPRNYKRSNSLTYAQFRYSFANELTDAEARALYAEYPVPGTSVTLFQAATANVNPRTEDVVDTLNPERGPLLIVTGALDHIAPPAIARASFARQKRNKVSATEYVVIPGRGHSLVFDSGWREAAQPALDFVQQFH
ncbi:MAG TPA: alpha/beta hydrolase [Galbitalea sp.]|jgi:pimeloyl-ACP methyl ester carboxylesterase|nr:alpha/beta hydrolase [Galbitalea sp.]